LPLLGAMLDAEIEVAVLPGFWVRPALALRRMTKTATFRRPRSALRMAGRCDSMLTWKVPLSTIFVDA
jgi:hypothetical protein